MELLTTEELARYLRLKQRSIYDLAAKKQIPCSRITGKLLFPKHHIDRWVEAHTEAPEPEGAPIYAGSSDPLLEWALRESGTDLAILTQGSRSGLDQLSDGRACLAGTHLFDPGTASYNVPAIRQRCPRADIVAFRWAQRHQGLLVAAGNPLGLSRLADLPTAKARLALRPEGTGSRALLETLLAEHDLALGQLALAAKEAPTEADLAGMIADGEADCGLGVAAVAGAHGLGFVGLDVWEAFDLVMPRRIYFQAAVQNLLAFARTDRFAQRAQRLGGYDLAELGRVTYNA